MGTAAPYKYSSTVERPLGLHGSQWFHTPGSINWRRHLYQYLYEYCTTVPQLLPDPCPRTGARVDDIIGGAWMIYGGLAIIIAWLVRKAQNFPQRWDWDLGCRRLHGRQCPLGLGRVVFSFNNSPQLLIVFSTSNTGNPTAPLFQEYSYKQILGITVTPSSKIYLQKSPHKSHDPQIE